MQLANKTMGKSASGLGRSGRATGSTATPNKSTTTTTTTTTTQVFPRSKEVRKADFFMSDRPLSRARARREGISDQQKIERLRKVADSSVGRVKQKAESRIKKLQNDVKVRRLTVAMQNSYGRRKYAIQRRRAKLTGQRFM